MYSGGSVVGKARTETPNGWETTADYAKVKVPSSPFNLKIASSSSTHIYRSNIYYDKSHHLSWYK